MAVCPDDGRRKRATAGSNIDRAEGQRLAASRASKVATDTAQEIKGVLEEAKATANGACANGKERTKACTDAGHRVDELLGKPTNAGTALLSAPIVAGEGDVGPRLGMDNGLSERASGKALSALALARGNGVGGRVLLEGSWGHLAEEIGARGRTSHS
jgi:hypothetical protein